MAVLTPTGPARAQNALARQSADPAGDSFANTGKELLLVEHTNGAGTDVDLTITTAVTVDGLDVTDLTITIPPGQRHLLGRWPPNIYSDTDGNVNLACSDATDIEVAVVSP